MPQMPGKPMMGMSQGQGMGGMSGGDAMGTVKQNMSIFNPVDAAAMRESGEITPQTTIREFFAQKGVDVDGPVSQLVQFVQDQAKKAQPMGKMQAIAGQGQPPQQQGPPPDLGGMIKQMRG